MEETSVTQSILNRFEGVENATAQTLLSEAFALVVKSTRKCGPGPGIDPNRGAVIS